MRNCIDGTKPTTDFIEYSNDLLAVSNFAAKIDEEQRAGRLHMFRFKGNWDLENTEDK